MKPLPNNLSAEQSVLGAVFLKPELISSLAHQLKAEDFYYDQHKILYRAFLEIYKDSRPIDPVTVCDKLGQKLLEKIGGHTYIANLASSALPVNALEHARIVKEYSNRRKVLKIAYDMYTGAGDEEKDPKDILSAAADSIFSLDNAGKKEPEPLGCAVMEAIDMVEAGKKTGGFITGMLTGYRKLDQMLNGLNPGDFVIIAGRSSMGKTAFALNIAANVSKVHPTAIFSLEMQRVTLALRMLSSATMIRLESLRKGKVLDNEEDRFLKMASSFAGRKMMLDDTSSLSVGDIKARCRKMKMKEGLDLVVIDYIGLIRGEGRSETRQQEISKISRQLKEMAMDLKVAVIALSQLNRAPEARAGNRPHLADLRESGAIEQDADIAMLLYREDYYNPESRNKGMVEITVAKNRNGPTGMVKLGWAEEFQKFKDLA